MTEFIGKVHEREIDYGNDIECVIEVTDSKNNTLSDILSEFMNDTIKVTIERIKGCE